MNERGFWAFLEGAWKKGRLPQSSAVSLNPEGSVPDPAGSYIGGHALLPAGYDSIPVRDISQMGELLRSGVVTRCAKEAIMMLLAHHGSEEALAALREYRGRAEGDLAIYAELALQECEIWNGERRRGGR